MAGKLLGHLAKVGFLHLLLRCLCAFVIRPNALYYQSLPEELQPRLVEDMIELDIRRASAITLLHDLVQGGGVLGKVNYFMFFELVRFCTDWVDVQAAVDLLWGAVVNKQSTEASTALETALSVKV